MLNPEENMTNLKDAKAQVTVGDIRTPTRTKRGNWHICQKRDRKLNYTMLTNTAVMQGLHTNLFRVMRALKKVFQVTSDGKTLKLRINSTDIRFEQKWRTKPAKYLY